jgi:hypothetical protein
MFYFFRVRYVDKELLTARIVLDYYSFLNRKIVIKSIHKFPAPVTSLCTRSLALERNH